LLDREIDAPQAAALIQKSEAEAFSTLQGLVEAGLIEAHGDRRTRLYRLTAATGRRLGEKPARVRRAGPESQRLEEMVLRFAKQNRSITRREASELCGIGPLQARTLLGRLRSRGLLARKGERRGAHYELSGEDMDRSITGMDKSICRS
jgi:ATP-dependent DNA helicase RecG